MPNIVTIGLECKAYYLSTGSRATWGAATNGIHSGAAPSNLTEATVVRNVTLNMTSSEADVSSRASTWKLVRRALRDASIDIEIPWEPSDAVFAALETAYFNSGASIAMAFLDGDKSTVGSQGLWIDAEVMEWTREESLEGAVMAKAKLVPTSSAVPPEWVKVA